MTCRSRRLRPAGAEPPPPRPPVRPPRRPARDLPRPGPPRGVGKTRLSIEAARELPEQFRDGTFFVPLAPVESAERAPTAIIEALELRPEDDRPVRTVLRDFLRVRECLLVLDNLEHIPDISLLVAELLAGAPDLTVLATSRVPLHVSGEHELEVPPLRVPSSGLEESTAALAENPSVALFEARARAVTPGFELTNANA